MQNEIKDKVRRYIAETMLDNDARGLDDNTNLTAGGVLDSFSVVQLMLFLEEEFEIELPRDRVTAQHFESIDTIAELVAGG